MKRKDDLLLEQLYQEGIIERLRGKGAALVKGAGAGLQKFGSKIAGTEAPKISARAEYAKAQQKSLLNSFKRKVESEIKDFYNDLKTFKVDPDPTQLEKDFPVIAQKLKVIQNLRDYLSDPEKYPKPSTISPDFEVLPPESSAEQKPQQQQSLPSTGEKLALPNNNRMGLPSPEEKDASKSNEEFLAARGVAQTPTQEKPTSSPVSDSQTPEERAGLEQVTQPPKQNPVNRMTYKGAEYSRDEEGNWIKHIKGSKFGNKQPLDAQRNRNLIKNLNSSAVSYTKEEKPVGSEVAAKKAAKRAPMAKSKIEADRLREGDPSKGALIGDSYNPFAEFLKGYQLV
jgi:hypothetical protein